MKYELLNDLSLSKGERLWVKTRDEFVMATAINEFRKTNSLKESIAHFVIFNLSGAHIRKYQRHYDSIMNSREPELMKFLNYYKMLYFRLYNNGYGTKDKLLDTIINSTCSLLDLSDIGIGKIEFLLICAKNDGVDIDIPERIAVINNFQSNRKRDRLTREDRDKLRENPSHITAYITENQICEALEISPQSYMDIDRLYLSKKVCKYIDKAKWILSHENF